MGVLGFRAVLIELRKASETQKSGCYIGCCDYDLTPPVRTLVPMLSPSIIPVGFRLWGLCDCSCRCLSLRLSGLGVRFWAVAGFIPVAWALVQGERADVWG